RGGSSRRRGHRRERPEAAGGTERPGARRRARGARDRRTGHLLRSRGRDPGARSSAGGVEAPLPGRPGPGAAIGGVPGSPLVRVVRSGLEESVHHVDIAVVDGDGKLVAWGGDADRIQFARSSMKPLQAAVSLSLAPFDFADREVAVMCASHNAEWVHLEAVRALLARAGIDEDALRCPAMRPWDDETLELDPTKRRLNSDCSGKHAGMLAACRAQGWPSETYRSPEHPLQQAVLAAVLAATD